MTKILITKRLRAGRISRTHAIATLLAATSFGTPLAAQITVQQPAASAMPQMSQTERDQINAQAMLTSALQRIGTNGNDVNALIDAGAAALVLEDARSAYNFFNRAQSLAPSNGRIKAGLGSALVRLENPADALKMFEQAVQQGAIERTFIADRGMAYDLIGDNAKAQRDYDAALKYQYSDRTLRFYALSLGISGEADRGIQMLAPLLQKKDRAAWRDRAFILAMNGRTKEATEIVKVTMPANVANGLTPYLLKMNRLSNRQMALAVHYGQFPTSDAQLASVGRGVTPAAPAAVAAAPVGKTARGKASKSNATETGRTPRFVDEQGRPVKLSRAEQRAALQEQEDKKKAEAARLAQEERDRAAAAAAAEAARQAETARQAQLAAEQARQAEAARQAELTRQAEIARQAETARLAEVQRQKMREEEAARLAAATQPKPAPIQTAMANPVATPPGVTPSVPTTPTPAAMVGPVDPIARANPAVQPVAVPASTAVEPGFTAQPAVVNPPPAAASGESFKAFSLDQLVQSVRPPEDGPVRAEAPVDLATLEKLRQDKIKAERAEAAREAAAKAKADADKKKLAEAKAAKDKAAAEAKAEADKLRANPARAWVQIGVGNAAGMRGDYRKASAGKNAELFKGKSAYSAAAGRSQRLVVGPFANARDANAWLAKFKKNGGNGMIWNSAAGEEVDQIGGK